MNYNGKATITFPIYRDVLGEEQEIVLKISGSSYYDAGRTSGPFDQCYPPSSDTELHSILLDGKPWDDILTEAENDEAKAQMELAVQEGDDEDPPSYKDF